MLPIYLVPVINLVVFYGLNGYLLGREYFEMVAQRRLEPAAMRLLWRHRRLAILALGAGLALILTFPVVNLAAPLIAAAAYDTPGRVLEGGDRGHPPCVTAAASR